MEYAFSVGARLGYGERVLTAADDLPTEIEKTAIPAPASFRGMPAARFWEFEDAQIDFCAVDAGPADQGVCCWLNMG